MTLLDSLQPIFRLLPEVKPPAKEVPLKRKIMWSALALVLFFVMGKITVIGLDATRAGALENLQVILASEMGSIISAGIGPIVLSSIILQLLVGAKFINMDLSNQADKAKFQSLQKLFSIVLCFFEATAYTITGAPLLAKAGFLIPVILQV